MVLVAVVMAELPDTIHVALLGGQINAGQFDVDPLVIGVYEVELARARHRFLRAYRDRHDILAGRADLGVA